MGITVYILMSVAPTIDNEILVRSKRMCFANVVSSDPAQRYGRTICLSVAPLDVRGRIYVHHLDGILFIACRPRSNFGVEMRRKTSRSVSVSIPLMGELSGRLTLKYVWLRSYVHLLWYT